MNQEEKDIYAELILLLGAVKINELNKMPESTKVTLSKCVKELGYNKIIDLHKEGKTYKEIAEKTGEQPRQVSRIIDADFIARGIKIAKVKKKK